MIIDLNKRWNTVRNPLNGITQISFGFIDKSGSPGQRQIVREAAKEWHECKVHFNENHKSPNLADVRITFGSNGCESKIGIEAQSVDRKNPTMFLKGIENPKELRRHVLHEFGHVLGAQHEHFHPQFPYNWDLSAIERQFRNDGFKDPKEKVKRDINQRYRLKEPGLLMSDDFDDKSIMIYRIYEDWLKMREPFNEVRKEFKGNYDLTYKDKWLMKRAYAKV